MPRSSIVRASFCVLAVVPLAQCNCDPVLTGLPTPQIEVSDAQGNPHTKADPWLVVALGDADSGTTTSTFVTVKNSGSGQLVFTDVCLVTAANEDEAKAATCTGVAAPFTFNNLAGQILKADEEARVDITFSPTIGGPASVWLQFVSNAEDEPKAAVELTGRGTDGRLCAEPNGIYDFGPVDIGTTVSAQITLRNCGVKPVTIDGFTFARNPDDAFTVAIAGAAPAVPIGPLAENETVVLDLTFTPQQPGPYRDTRAGDIAITTAAPFVGQYDLILLGDGVEPPSCKINVFPETLNFGAVASNASRTEQILIQSVGQCGCTVDTISGPEPLAAGFVLGALPTLPLVLQGTVGCEGDPAGADAAPRSVSIDVTYTAPDRDPPVVDRATVTVTSSDLVEPTQVVNLEANGGGSPFCQLDVQPSGTPQFAIPPVLGRFGVVTFGRTSVHVPKRLPITIKNIGNIDCHVSNVQYEDAENTTNNEFSVETEVGGSAIGASFAVAPGDTATLFAVFSPTHTLASDGIFGAFNFGSYSGSLGTSGSALFCHVLNEASCNGVLITTDDTRTDITSGGSDSIHTTPGQFSLGFSGTPVAPLVDIIPGELDFGLVTLDCGSPQQRVTVYNNGGADLVVQEPTIDPATTPATFVVEGTSNPTNTWPMAIPPGGSLSILVRYYARAVGLQTAQVLIPTVEGGSEGPPVTIPLRGEGTTEISAHDVFQQFSDPKTDVLFVVDDSGSMQPFQQQLADNFDQFFTASHVADADYHIAVTTTLTVDDGCVPAPPTCSTSADCGGSPCVLGLCTAGQSQVSSCPDDPMSGWYTSCDSEHFLSPASPNPEGQFNCNVQVSGNTNPSRSPSDSAEGGFRAAYNFLRPPNIDDVTINGGFMRDDAKLHVIMVSDEPEQSKGSVDQYIDFFRNVKGFRNEGLVAVSAIATPSAGCTFTDGTQLPGDPRYETLVGEMNGRFQSICNPDWTGMMSQLGLDSLGLRIEFFLSRAATAATLDVCVRAGGASDPVCSTVAQTSDGAANGYFYDSVSNSIVFNPGSVPPRGSQIEVDYNAFCF